MEKTKLEKIKEYIEDQLIENLPVSFHNLDYVEPTISSVSSKAIIIDKYSSNVCEVIGFYKPIAKCIDYALTN